MLKNKKMIILLVVEVLLVVLSIILLITHLGEYAIITCALVVFMFLFLYNEYKNLSASGKSKYDNKVDKLIKTYGPIMISTNELPNMKDKSFLPIEKIEGLLDAQAEIREPIYYVKKDDSTIFFIINKDSVLYTFIKVEGIGETDLEKEFMAKKDGINLEPIKDIEHTIVVHSDDKSFSISPIETNNKEDQENDEDEDFKTVPIKVTDIKAKAEEDDEEDFKTIPLKIVEDKPEEEKQEEVEEDEEDFKTIPLDIVEDKEEVSEEENKSEDDEII